MGQNNASRIHAILVEAKRHLPHTPTLTSWSKALKVSDSLDDVAPLLVEMLRQLDEVEIEIKDKVGPAKAAVSLKYIPDIRKALSFQDINRSGANVAVTLSAEALYSLEVLTHELDDETEMKMDDLAKINDLVTELFDMVEKSDINKKLRDWIMGWLSAIRRSIDRYRITGTKGLQDVLIRIQGEAIILQPAVEKIEKESPTIYNRLVSLFEIVYKVSDVIERCRKLCESPVAVHAVSFTMRALGVDVPPTQP